MLRHKDGKKPYTQEKQGKAFHTEETEWEKLCDTKNLVAPKSKWAEEWQGWGQK